MNMKYAIMFSLLFFALSFAASEAMPSQILQLTPQLEKGALAWFVARDKADQKPITKKDLETIIDPKAKRVALVFFATWCVPCIEGTTLLRDNQAELEKNGVQVILVNAGESDVPKIESWIKKYGSENWPLILDKFKNIQKSTGLISETVTEIVFPKTILLDNKLKPLLLIGAEGKDWPEILWK
jgi:thiol-disulfide isomerase/thioredoxin